MQLEEDLTGDVFGHLTPADLLQCEPEDLFHKAAVDLLEGLHLVYADTVLAGRMRSQPIRCRNHIISPRK